MSTQYNGEVEQQAEVQANPARSLATPDLAYAQFTDTGIRY